MCKKIYETGVRSVSISLDSISASKHDSLRNVSGAYDMAINGINNAVEFGKFDELIINTTLTDFNYEEIPQIYEYAKELGGYAPGLDHLVHGSFTFEKFKEYADYVKKKLGYESKSQLQISFLPRVL